MVDLEQARKIAADNFGIDSKDVGAYDAEECFLFYSRLDQFCRERCVDKKTGELRIIFTPEENIPAQKID